MKRLLYISTAHSTVSSKELEDLLATARTANSAANVTGLLVVGGRRFMQVLEGPDLAVNVTYERIKRDPRHFALVKLHENAISERYFPGWSMGFERGGCALATASLEKQVEAMVAPVADANLRAYFTGFAKIC